MLQTALKLKSWPGRLNAQPRFAMPGEAELAQAHQWVQEHRWLAAQHSLNQLHRRHPSNAQIRADLARVLLALGDPQRALELLTPA